MNFLMKKKKITCGGREGRKRQTDTLEHKTVCLLFKEHLAVRADKFFPLCQPMLHVCSKVAAFCEVFPLVSYQ